MSRNISIVFPEPLLPQCFYHIVICLFIFGRDAESAAVAALVSGKDIPVNKSTSDRKCGALRHSRITQKPLPVRSSQSGERIQGLKLLMAPASLSSFRGRNRSAPILQLLQPFCLRTSLDFRQMLDLSVWTAGTMSRIISICHRVLDRLVVSDLQFVLLVGRKGPILIPITPLRWASCPRWLCLVRGNVLKDRLVSSVTTAHIFNF